MPVFPCPEPITIRVRIPAGSIDIVAEDRPDAEVDVSPADGRDSSRDLAERTTIEMDGTTLTVAAPDGVDGLLWRRNGKLRVQARVPTDSSVAVTVASADLRCRGRIGSLTTDGASADITADHVTGDADIKTASGDLEIDRVDGGLSATGASGDVRASVVGGAIRLKSASGDVNVGAAGSDVSVKSASGDVSIGSAATGTTKIETVSGDVRIGVPTGTGVWLDLNTLSGSTRSDLDMKIGDSSGEPPQHQLTLQIRTVSGDIQIRRVAAPAA